MGWNDHIDDDYVELPPEAERAAYPFDPHDKWLRDASREHQFEAMRRWFLARFEDPAESTPYDNGEGGYLFLHGSVDPDDAIQERFSPFVDFEVMQELVNELYSHVGPEWATIDRGEDYWDDELAVYIESRDEPMARMSLRLKDIIIMLNDAGLSGSSVLVVQLAHTAAITAIETYLWDLVNFWITEDSATLKRFISNDRSDFGSRKIPVREMFAEHDEITTKFRKHLQTLVWHRLDKIKPMLEDGFGFTIPPIDALMAQIVIRQHIAHRGGRDEDGKEIFVNGMEVGDLIAMVLSFAGEIEDQLRIKYPPSTT